MSLAPRNARAVGRNRPDTTVLTAKFGSSTVGPVGCARTPLPDSMNSSATKAALMRFLDIEPPLFCDRGSNTPNAKQTTAEAFRASGWTQLIEVVLTMHWRFRDL